MERGKNAHTDAPTEQWKPVWKRPRKTEVFTPWTRLPRYRIKLTEKQKHFVEKWNGEEVEDFAADQGEPLEIREARSLYRQLDAGDIPAITGYLWEKANESDLDRLKYQAWCDLCKGLDDFTIYRDQRGPEFYEQYRNARALVIRWLRKRYGVELTPKKRKRSAA